MTQNIATVEQLAVDNIHNYQFYETDPSTLANLFGNTDLDQFFKTGYDKRIKLSARHFCRNKTNDTHGYSSYYSRNSYDYHYTHRNNKPADAELVTKPVVVFMKPANDFQNYDRTGHRYGKNTDMSKHVVRCGMIPSCGDLLWSAGEGRGSANFIVEFDIDGRRATILTTYLMAKQLLGVHINRDLTYGFDNGTSPITNAAAIIKASAQGRYRYHNDPPEEKILALNVPSTLSSWYFCDTQGDSIDNFFAGYFAETPMEEDPPLAGIKKTWEKMRPFLAELRLQHPLHYLTLRSMCIASNKSVDTVKVSSVFNDSFVNATKAQDVYEAIEQAVEFVINDPEQEQGYYHYRRYDWKELVKGLGSYKAKRKQALQSSSTRAFAKLMEDYEFLQMNEEKYPLTTAAIKEGRVPVSTFFRKSEQYFLLNDNWQLWEEMLTKYPEEASELANEVKGRTTYEKDLMSYFQFVLRTLPKYLEKHTGYKWECKPKLVTSENELEPPVEGENGVAKKRSALTPIVDNEARTVEVPYASLAIAGRQTTYCYSHDYHVLTEGFSFNGNAVTDELEVKLNGRDDYGLMFYTLTGSAQGRGYPSFLIIFERLKQKGKTRVHFHRVHPSRSKSGDYNPIHNWIKVCYNYMAGNVNKNNIKAQQGDLFFVAQDENAKLTFGDFQVNSCDGHTFDEQVQFAEYDKAAKTNILGYVKLDKELWLRHQEHDDVKVPVGVYAIHQCRSWEANPKGVWSLRID
jgi:hypothetical protein